MDIIKEIEHDAEELFPPKPGGLVDRYRKKKAEEEAAREAGSDSTIEEIGRNKVKAVRTVVEAADIASAQSVLLNANAPVARLLARDDHRRSAVILAVDNDVYLTTDNGMAWNIQGSNTNIGGFYLPAGIAIPIESTSEVWAAATTTGTSSRVSVFINRGSAA